MSSERYIYDLIAQGEHIGQDFKFEISDVRKIARTLSAFANTKGGRLLVGVKDNGRIAGVKSDEEAYMIDAAAKIYSSPEIDYRINSHLVMGKIILEVIIPEGNNKPYFAKVEPDKTIAFLRVEDENIVASPVHLQLWRREAGEKSLLFRYREYEQILMKYLSEHDSVTLSKICRETIMTRKDVIKLLAEFAYLDLVSIEYQQGSFSYSLRPAVSPGEEKGNGFR